MEVNHVLADEKLIIALISAAVALLLGQLVVYIKYRINKCQTKRALFKELQDIEISLESAIAITRHKLEMNVHMIHSGTMPLPVGSYIFDNYYKEVVSELSSSQRRSYQLIHHYVKDINASIENLTKKNIEASEAYFLNPSSIDVKHRKLWFDRLASFYEVLCLTQWHISYHKENRRNPELPYNGPVYDDYVAFQQDIQLALKELIEEAKKKSAEEVAEQKTRL
ncbi:hypothetical protein NDJ85_18555 [Vibrio parahaemolyticus]|uniref:hypothetical protein n=1 Tax=Vibrio parahaemolyticus TaxID=670 RepID=UPI00215FD3C2|nr:hypothetical protein [Vibrio parahaemolyticus]MCS0079784.1 hypothetical protein [Vibrio parahaemolyticus]HCH5095901.1 hypothetical protein [Vibrio parahaemolyticus]